MDDTITLVSTTDTPEDVQLALTGAEKPADTPAEKPAEAPAAGTPAATPEAAKPAETPAAPEKTADETETPPANETAEQKAARLSASERRKQKIQREIDELTANKHNLRRDAELEAAELARLKAEKSQVQAEIDAAKGKKPQAAASTPTAPAAAGTTDEIDVGEPARPMPKLDDLREDGVAKYANYEEFVEDMTKWTVEETGRRSRVVAEQIASKALKDKDTADRARIERESATRAQQDALAKHDTRIEEFKKAHADFDAVMADARDVVADLQDAHGLDALAVVDRFTVQDAENGPALMYYLAQHPDELKQIAAKPVPQQIIALAKLDSRLGAASPSPGPSPAATPVTRAPEPIKPVSSSPTPSTVSPDDEDYQAYKARRDREDLARYGRVLR